MEERNNLKESILLEENQTLRDKIGLLSKKRNKLGEDEIEDDEENNEVVRQINARAHELFKHLGVYLGNED